MGSGASTGDGIRQEWMNMFYEMKFTRAEVKNLWDVYNTIDIDRSGSIDVPELLKFLDIGESLFTERIFAAFDKDGTGKIDFFEFVVALWKFCALGTESISVFAFDLFDTDGDGALTDIEVKILFYDLYWYGVPTEESQESRRVLAELLQYGDGYITIEGFGPFCKTHMDLLKPIFDVQTKLRNLAMGPAFWEAMSKRKIELSRGHSVELSELMVQASDRETFNAILHERRNGLRGMMRRVLQSAEMSLFSPTIDENTPSHSENMLIGQRLFSPFSFSSGSISRDERDYADGKPIAKNRASIGSTIGAGSSGDSYDATPLGH